MPTKFIHALVMVSERTTIICPYSIGWLVFM